MTGDPVLTCNQLKGKMASYAQMEPKCSAEPFMQDSLLVVGGPSTKQTQADIASANITRLDMQFHMQHLASSTAVVVLL